MRFTIYSFRCEAIDSELNRVGKTNRKRIVSMLTQLIQRTDSVSEGSIEYEKKQEQSVGNQVADWPR